MWFTTCEMYVQTLFQTKVRRPSSPGAVVPFAAFSALSISSSVTGTYGISSFRFAFNSGVGSAIFGKKDSRST